MTVFTSRQKCARSVCHFCFGALFPSKLFSVIHSNESRCFFLCLCLSLPVLRPIDASFQRFMIYEGNVSSLSFSSQSLFQKNLFCSVSWKQHWTSAASPILLCFYTESKSMLKVISPSVSCHHKVWIFCSVCVVITCLPPFFVIPYQMWIPS